jgi:hypothetical protein
MSGTPDLFGLVFDGEGGVFGDVFAVDAGPTAVITAGEDDAETIPGIYIDDSGETIQFGEGFDDPYWGLFRFASGIASGSTVLTSKLRFVSIATQDTSSDTYTIDVADADNAAMPTDVTELAAVEWTTATATGNFGSLVAGEPFDTFDISDAIQEVVNRPGFSGTLLIRVRGVVFVAVAAYEHPTYDPAELWATWDEPEPPTFQAAWAMGSNVMIQPGAF